MAQTVVLLHTNDFHNHLSAAQAQTLQRAKQDSGPNTLLLDSGDAISAGNVGVRPGGEPILTLMSAVGYDAMTLGNREFHIAEALLRHKIGSAAFPILCANMRFKNNQAQQSLPVQAHLIKTLTNGVRVGVIGVTVPMVTERMAARHVSAFLFDDPIAVMQREAAALRPQVDLLIALTHIGIKADEHLAQNCPELDLIITGHTHLVIRHDHYPSGVPIVQTGWFGHNYGRIEIALEAGARPRITNSEILRLEASAL